MIEPLTELLTWWDVLDIAIVSLVIYEFLKLIRRTRAVQVAVGLGLVVVLYYGSQFFPLRTINWLIRDMFVVFAFAAVVLFQSDIRRALAHFGRAPFFRYFAKSPNSGETIEEVVVASTMLAGQRIGAIIAIEREIGLVNYIESGIPLDATLTYDLLLTVFQPGSPLHGRRGDRAREPGGGRRLLLAPDDQSAARQRPGHATPGGDRSHGRM